MRNTLGLTARSPAWSGLPAKPIGDKIVVAGADGVVRSFSRADGEKLWATKLPEESLDFRVSDNYVVTSGRDSMAVMSQDDGRLMWQQSDGRDLVGLTSHVVLTQQRGEVKALNLVDGQVEWRADSLQPALTSEGLTLTVSGERDRAETLEVRESNSGEIRWSTTDGNIEHIVAKADSILYTNQKLGRHHQTVQYVTSRSLDGDIQWTHECDGKLRAEPKYSPDGKQIILHEHYPQDPSRSYVSTISSETGELSSQFVGGHDLDITFLTGGHLALAEAEYSLIPGQGEKRLRVVDPNGRELWSEEGRPQWMLGGESLVTWSSEGLKSRSTETGEIQWSQPFSGDLIPVSTDGERASFLQNGCRLITLNLESGEAIKELTTGHRLILDSDPNGLVSDHEGQVFKHDLPTGEESLLVGEWKELEPFHMPFLSGPAKRAGKDAVFVDWDGDEQDDGEDPILLGAQNRVVSWRELQARDAEVDSTLETAQLSDLKLWFDLNRDGEVSSAAELSALIAENSFDKGRFHLDKNELWLASDSRCSD